MPNLEQEPTASHVIRFKGTNTFLCLVAIPTPELMLASKFTTPEEAAETMSKLPGTQPLEIVKYDPTFPDAQIDAVIDQVMEEANADKFWVENNRNMLRTLCRFAAFTYIASAEPVRCSG